MPLIFRSNAINLLRPDPAGRGGFSVVGHKSLLPARVLLSHFTLLRVTFHG
jgi:hypothetical protein